MTSRAHLRCARRSRTAGFTLMEVLVASVLIATAFVAVVSLMSQSLRNLDRMKPHERAMAHAREKMNEELLREQLAPEHSIGRWDDGYDWRVDIAPQPSMARASANQPVQGAQQQGPMLFAVRVQVGWGDAQSRRSYEVATTQWAQLTPEAQR